MIFSDEEREPLNINTRSLILSKTCLLDYSACWNLSSSWLQIGEKAYTLQNVLCRASYNGVETLRNGRSDL